MVIVNNLFGGFVRSLKLVFLVISLLATCCFFYYPKVKLHLGIEKALNIPEKYPDNYWEKNYKNLIIKKKYKVVYIANQGGEYSHAEYFKYGAEKYGWKVKIYQNDIKGYENEILRFNPDFIIFTEHSPINDIRIKSHKSKKYMIIMPPVAVSLIKRLLYNNLSPRRHYLEKISIADGILTSSPKVNFYKEIFDKKLYKNFYGFRLLPTVPKFSFEAAEPKSLIWVGMGWDNFRSSNNYKKFIKLLTSKVNIKVYGFFKFFAYLNRNNYDGFIPLGIENIQAIRKNGIYLLTHSDLHIKEGNPSLRLFEAAAANVVIISDLNPFTVKHFGDSVLYFDQNSDAKTMSEQVAKHVKWILHNPKEAKHLANKAHEIFLNKFTLEKDLIRIAKMHEAVLQGQEFSYNYVYN